MAKYKETFIENDFVLIKNALTSDEVKVIDEEYNNLILKAKQIIAFAKDNNLTLGEFYKQNHNELIVVPEANNPLEPCRFEYINNYSEIMRNSLISKVNHLIEDFMGKPFVLFKDKCNVKNSGGGAFPPHQDMTAYRYFKPRFHVTAAVILDPSNILNGCVEMANGYKEHITATTQMINSTFGTYPLFNYYEGGKRNGDIEDAISTRFNWVPVEANPGDILLFNSYVPHCSKKNNSQNRRRNFFLTFNAASEGDWYQEYYNKKKQDYDNPIFHVSTPTIHSESL